MQEKFTFCFNGTPLSFPTTEEAIAHARNKAISGKEVRLSIGNTLLGVYRPAIQPFLKFTDYRTGSTTLIECCEVHPVI